ncbi:MAG: SpoIID/LytB domain-containing protein, partial [Clostridia bacterium]
MKRFFAAILVVIMLLGNTSALASGLGFNAQSGQVEIPEQTPQQETVEKTPDNTPDATPNADAGNTPDATPNADAGNTPDVADGALDEQASPATETDLEQVSLAMLGLDMEDPLLLEDGIAPEDKHILSPEDLAGISTMAVTDYTYARVRLSTEHTCVNVTVHGNYSLQSNGNAVALLQNGAKYALSYSGSQVVIATTGGTELYRGTSFTLQEHTPPAGMAYNYFTLNNTYRKASINYKGSLYAYKDTVGAVTGVYLVNRVYIEDYLKGVIGFEIGDGYNAEALKTQAIIARTYALGYIKSSGNYDLVDTSTNQVYGGVPNHPNSAAAVDATAGIIAVYGGTKARMYYSASNGGEIELAAHRWTDNTVYPYEVSKADENDLAYISASAAGGSSNYAEFAKINKTKPTGKLANALITNSLIPALNNNGYSVNSAADVVLEGVEMAATPKSNHNHSGGACSQLASINVTYTGSVAGTAFKITATVLATDLFVGNNWGVFTNSSLGEYWLTDMGNYYELRHARFGHGIGVSQVGARYMAANGSNYQSIISFYYPGVGFERSAGIGTPSLTPMPNNIQTKMVTMRQSAIYAQASESSNVLLTLSAGSEVTITGTSGGFYEVTNGVISGYMLISAFDPAYTHVKIVNVTTSCNVRSGAGTNYSIVGPAPKDAVYELLSTDYLATWLKIKYTSADYPSGTTAYVNADYAELLTAAEVTLPKPVKGVSLDKGSITVFVGKQEKLTATITPSDADNPVVVWSSSNAAVASVDTDGNVTGISKGTAYITAAAADGSGKSARCTLTVMQPVTQITLNYADYNMAVGRTVSLRATVQPNNAGLRTVTWSSSAPDVASVTSSGSVRGVSRGTAIISATAADGSGVNAQCVVRIVQMATGVTLNMSTLPLAVGESADITPTILPASTDIKELVWVSSNPAVASVQAVEENGVWVGRVTAADKAGRAVITATATDGSGKSARCTIEVVK